MPAMRIALLGLGLIGGSIALALRRSGADASLVAWTPSGRGPAAAVAAGAIDQAAGSVLEALEGTDLAVLAAPPLECLRLLDAIPASDATVTDVASTKAAIVARADAIGPGIRFVGGHPMAGRETTGFGAATPDLFDGRPWVVVPGAYGRGIDVERVEWLARSVGAVPLRMEAGAHDAAVAGISHLPLVLAAALVEAVTGAPGWDDAWRLSASGWRDMTRLARGDVTMGTGIAVSNRTELAKRIRAARAVLDGWLVDLEGADSAAIERRLARAKAALEESSS
jgi:prephenate dehydrogenase